MRLVHKTTGVEVKIGDKVQSFRGETAYVTGWQKPTSPASEGRINVSEYQNLDAEKRMVLGHAFYVSVYECEWIEREDRNW